MHELAASEFTLNARLASDLMGASTPEIPWLWQGYLACGGVTLLTSQWKAGKTTLVSLLLARLGEGGMLAGQPVRPGKALVVSEEEPTLWCQRSQHLGLGNQAWLSCRPFVSRPTPGQWQQLLHEVRQVHQQVNLDLLVIDPLAGFLPVADENNAVGIQRALAPLRNLTSLGMAVLLLHHPRKGKTSAGQASRGSGALLGFVDVMIEMEVPRQARSGSRRRRLQAWSRYGGTPAHLEMELNPEGTDYVVVVDREVNEERGPRPVPEGLRAVLEEEDRKMTRREIWEEWPDDHAPRPDAGTLSRWLQEGVETGQLRRDGTGRRSHPFRYWFPEQEERWRQDPAFLLGEEIEREAWQALEEYRARRRGEVAEGEGIREE
jgi:RecA-family ATPase